MPDARGVDGSPPRPSLRAAALKRPLRKPADGSGSVAAPTPAAPVPVAPPAPPVERVERVRPGGLRVNDLYSMPMPELFALAEKEGIREHTGMSRAHLI